jgi:hypothetical protein
LANASNVSANYVVGVATENINNNASGLVTNKGLVRDFDTSSWAPGTVLYLSDTPGEFTSTIPTGTSRIVALGVVVHQDASKGVILIDVRIHYALENISFVSITGVQVGDHLVAGYSGVWYNSSTGIIGTAGQQGETGLQGETGPSGYETNASFNSIEITEDRPTGLNAYVSNITYGTSYTGPLGVPEGTIYLRYTS